MSAPLDLYHLNLNRPATRLESTEMLEKAGVSREVIDWFWEQLELLDRKYQDEIGLVQWQNYNLEVELKEAGETIKKQTEALKFAREQLEKT